jgi:hypothetical protein
VSIAKVMKRGEWAEGQVLESEDIGDHRVRPHEAALQAEIRKEGDRAGSQDDCREAKRSGVEEVRDGEEAGQTLGPQSIFVAIPIIH